jgi:hypothetical protein
LLEFRVLGRRKLGAAAPLVLNATAHQLKQRAEDARTVTAQMRDLEAKRTMATLALTYERLAAQSLKRVG